MQQLHDLLIQASIAAQRLFPKKAFRIWYVKLHTRAWKCIIFDVKTKEKISEGPIRATPEMAMLAMNNILAAQVKKSF